ncbi:hypothetical protein [Streptomyces sp. NPDC002845]
MNKTQKSLIGYSTPRPCHAYAPVLHYDLVDGPRELVHPLLAPRLSVRS